MKGLYLEPSPEAQWYSLVYDARVLSGSSHLGENLEAYLVLTLDHFTTENKLASTVLALDFLNAMETPSHNVLKLRDVGDQCLILSGLFPERAKRKQVSLDYFIKLGKGAYHSISHQENGMPFDPELFYQLSVHFVGLLDILHHMRMLALSHK